jgi:hypothetical protein
MRFTVAIDGDVLYLVREAPRMLFDQSTVAPHLHNLQRHEQTYNWMKLPLAIGAERECKRGAYGSGERNNRGLAHIRPRAGGSMAGHLTTDNG